MKREYLAGLAMGLIVLLNGCSDAPAPPADTSAADIKALKDGEVAWATDWASKDGDKIVSHYAVDASLLMADSPILTGRSNIRAGIQPLLSDPNLSLSFTTVNAGVSKDLGYTQGTYSMTTTNPKTKKPATEIGKYVTVYKRQSDGSWKAIEDIENADAPATPVAAAPAKHEPAAKKKKKR
jgi:ketosteroid isomerase-like protein